MAKECLVIPTEVLEQEGVLPLDRVDQALYIPIDTVGGTENIYRLAALYGEYRERSGKHSVEEDPSFQQFIMYAFIIKDRRFLAYQRGSAEEGKYDESRLAGKVALGLGGHMERTDLALEDSLFREIDEEAQIVIDDKPVNFQDGADGLDIRSMRNLLDLTPVGLIKDERDAVGKVHLGIACRFSPKNPNTDIRVRTDGENVSYRYLTLRGYQSLVGRKQITPEGWSDIVFRKEIQPDLNLLTPLTYNPRTLPKPVSLLFEQ